MAAARQTPKKRAVPAPSARRWVVRCALVHYQMLVFRLTVFVTAVGTKDLPWLEALEVLVLFDLETVSGRLPRFTKGGFSNVADFVTCVITAGRVFNGAARVCEGVAVASS